MKKLLILVVFLFMFGCEQPMPEGRIEVGKWEKYHYLTVTIPVGTPTNGFYDLKERYLTTSEMHNLLDYLMEFVEHAP